MAQLMFIGREFMGRVILKKNEIPIAVSLGFTVTKSPYGKSIISVITVNDKRRARQISYQINKTRTSQ